MSPIEGRSEELIAKLLDLGPEIRYVAVYHLGRLASRERSALAGASSSESDRYEELIVNPTLLKLLTQRGEIGCGGVRFVVVRYGNFFQAIIPMPEGHVSVALEPTVEPPRFVHRIRQIVDEWLAGTGG
jgi:hypothetical protein